MSIYLCTTVYVHTYICILTGCINAMQPSKSERRSEVQSITAIVVLKPKAHNYQALNPKHTKS